MEEAFRGITSVSIGKQLPNNSSDTVNLNSVIFQDDIGKMSDKIEDAKIGSQMIYDPVKMGDT